MPHSGLQNHLMKSESQLESQLSALDPRLCRLLTTFAGPSWLFLDLHLLPYKILSWMHCLHKWTWLEIPQLGKTGIHRKFCSAIRMKPIRHQQLQTNATLATAQYLLIITFSSKSEANFWSNHPVCSKAGFPIIQSHPTTPSGPTWAGHLISLYPQAPMLSPLHWTLSKTFWW